MVRSESSGPFLCFYLFLSGNRHYLCGNLAENKRIMLGLISKGIVIGVLVSAPMGPIGMLCIQRTLNKGRWHGFVTGLGAALSDVIYAALTCRCHTGRIARDRKQYCFGGQLDSGISCQLCGSRRYLYDNVADGKG